MGRRRPAREASAESGRSLAIILVGVYYSANIFFLGAELTQVLARRRGEEIRPARGAVRVVLERTVIREDP